jgi:hypothetical protein
MSKWVSCEVCGQLKEIPAYDGDGVYSVHICSQEPQKTEPPKEE